MGRYWVSEVFRREGPSRPIQAEKQMSGISPRKRGGGVSQENGLGIGHLSHKAAQAFSREPFSDSQREDVSHKKSRKWPGGRIPWPTSPPTPFHNFGWVTVLLGQVFCHCTGIGLGFRPDPAPDPL